MSLDVHLCQGEDRIHSCHFCTEELRPHCWSCKGTGIVNSGPPCVYDSNITHNLNKMAEEAGFYNQVWRPDECGVTKAGQLIEPLREGIARLRADPGRFKAFSAPNGWGTYEQFVPWLEDYLYACENYPDAEVLVSR